MGAAKTRKRKKGTAAQKATASSASPPVDVDADVAIGPLPFFPPFFVPDPAAITAPMPAPTFPWPRDRVRGAIDRFQIGDGDDEWTVVLVDAGTPILVAPSRRSDLSETVRASIVSNVVQCAPRRVRATSFHLFAIDRVTPGPDLVGPNDPVLLEGTLTGPFPTGPVIATRGKLTSTRGELLDASVWGSAHAFHALTTQEEQIIAKRWFHLFLAAAPEHDIDHGRGLVLAYPVDPGMIELGDHDNEGVTARFLHAVLAALQTDASVSRSAFATRPIPMASRAETEAALRTRGFTIDGNVADRKGDGFFGALIREKIALPPEGRVEDFLRLAHVALDLLPGWPEPRTRALRRLVPITCARWTADAAVGVRPVPFEDGPFEIEGGVIASLRFGTRKNDFLRYVYFDVDDVVSEMLRGSLELEIEYFDECDPFWIQCNAIRGDYAGDVKSTPVAATGTKTWRRATVVLPRAHFRNAQQSCADFRICVVGVRPLKVRELIVRFPRD